MIGSENVGRSLGVAVRRAATVAFLLLAGCGSGGNGTTPSENGFGLVSLPDGDGDSRAVRLYPAAGQESRWCVFRGWPDERIHVFESCDTSAPHRVPFGRGLEGELLLFQVADIDDTIYLLTYDARLNVPSGRIPGVVSDGVGVWRIRGGASPEATKLAEKLPLGGFDNVIYAQASAAGLRVCAIRRCFTIDDATAPHEWTLPAMGSYELLEMVFADAVAYAIVRTPDDAITGNVDTAGFHYALAQLDPAGASIERISSDCIPYRLAATPGHVSWSCARTPAELADVQKFDFARLPHSGLIDYGASNLEGRMAWSQVYYLNGLMQLGGPYLPRLRAAGDWSLLRERLRNEVALAALHALASDDGLASRRYSLTRTPITFALHLGRIGQTLHAAYETGHDSPEAVAARTALAVRLFDLSGTVEEAVEILYQGKVYASLRYTKGSDFWADGANVPHNYVSGYVLGLLSLSGEGTAVARAVELMQAVVDVEGIDSKDMWDYWWAQGEDGWTAADQISVNTPEYSGFRGVAHITYRSMDAAALLRLREVRPEAVTSTTVQHLARLVSTGKLLPLVNQELVRIGTAATLDQVVAYRYARSGLQRDVQSQVWALEQLAAGG